MSPGIFLRRLLKVLVGSAVLMVTATQARHQDALDPAALLDLYAAGRFQDALDRVASADDAAGRALRSQWRTKGSAWIDMSTDRASHQQRLLVAAALALEVEVARAERGDWTRYLDEVRGQALIGGAVRSVNLCSGPCQISWMRELLVERGLADAPARAWYAAANALVQGTNDWRTVYHATIPETPLAGGTGLAQHALRTFSGDPLFRFDRALALASRMNITVDGEPRSGRPTIDLSLILPDRRARATASVYATHAAALEFEALAADPAIGPAAATRLGYLLWATGQDAQALEVWARAAAAATASDDRYLAHFLAGWAQLLAGADVPAAQALGAALEARADSQSAALSLAAIELRRGDAEAAHARVDASLSARPTDDDPWRVFLYGRHAQLPALIAALRHAVSALGGAVGSDRGQTGVRPGSDQGQTRVRPGSDQGQTGVRPDVTGPMPAGAFDAGPAPEPRWSTAHPDPGAPSVAHASFRTPAPQQAPVYRASVAQVLVNVSVKRGNNAVPNLTAADFRVTDNGVAQTIESLAIENVPIDVTLFLDTSGSTAGKLDEMADDVQAIAKMLQSGDRFRLLTIGDSVYPAVPWTPSGTPFRARFDPVGGISLIHDALLAALVHQPSPGRRHLIVGMTDRADCGSVIPSALLLELAGRTDAVMHLVDYSGGGSGRPDYRVRSCTPRARSGGAAMIEQAAERTGGALRGQALLFRGASIARAFRAILDDFRQSYVLRYTATGVDGPGWHAIEVTVPGVRGASVRARQGYYGK